MSGWIVFHMWQACIDQAEPSNMCTLAYSPVFAKNVAHNSLFWLSVSDRAFQVLTVLVNAKGVSHLSIGTLLGMHQIPNPTPI